MSGIREWRKVFHLLSHYRAQILNKNKGSVTQYLNTKIKSDVGRNLFSKSNKDSFTLTAFCLVD